jgi:tetratricopeptide (TPR) repeat protein
MSDAPTPAPDAAAVDGPDHEQDLLPHDRLAPGQRIGRFVVEQRLGEGTMGVVHAARDPALARRVAIKLVRPEIGGDPRAQDRLYREARALAKVSHPNIVTIHEVGEHRGQVFLAMEHVQGQSLRAWQESEPRSTSDVLAVYLQAGRGLAAAHAAGLVHRDFKPDNVLLDEEGRARVVGFGSLVGTPAYMSPEQLEGGAVDHRSDQFGFCVALWEALYGRHPFAAASLASLQDCVVHGRRSEPPKRSQVPAWIHRLLVRGLAVVPDDRHPSLAALLDALSRDPVVTRRRWLAVGALVLAASAGTYALAKHGGDDPGPSCEGVVDELATTWNPAHRAALGETMLATGLAHAEQTWARVGPGIDAYAAEWTAARTEACVARRDAAASERQHDLRVACLERRRAALDAIVDALGEPTHGDVDNAARAVASLPTIAACADVEALAAAIEPPEEPELAVAVEGQRQTLARARQQEVLGRYDEGRGLAQAVLDSPEAQLYTPLAAEALLSLGAIELAASHHETATEALSRAIEVGMRVDHFEVAAGAFARRIFTYGKLGRGADAVREIPLARALVERTGDDQLRWLLLHDIGTVHRELEQCVEAKQSYLGALEAMSRAHGEERFELALTLEALSGAESCLGDEGAARRAADRASAIRERVLGTRQVH